MSDADIFSLVWILSGFISTILIFFKIKEDGVIKISELHYLFQILLMFLLFGVFGLVLAVYIIAKDERLKRCK